VRGVFGALLARILRKTGIAGIPRRRMPQARSKTTEYSPGLETKPLCVTRTKSIV